VNFLLAHGQAWAAPSLLLQFAASLRVADSSLLGARTAISPAAARRRRSLCSLCPSSCTRPPSSVSLALEIQSPSPAVSCSLELATARALLSWQRVLALGLSISLRLLAWIPPSRPSPSRPAPCCRELQLGFRRPPFSNPCAGPCRIVLVRSARRRLRQLSSFVVAPFAVQFRYPSRSSLLATTCRASASSLSLLCRLSTPSRFLAVVVFLVIPAASVVIKHVCCRELAPSVHSVSGPRFL
jgi:hypothetical protein